MSTRQPLLNGESGGTDVILEILKYLVKFDVLVDAVRKCTPRALHGRGHARQTKARDVMRRGFRACLNEDLRSPRDTEPKRALRALY